MGQKLEINPVTRIEGHAKITIQLGNDGSVADARFHVTQVRGFEKIGEGRPFHEMPAITARICGICPVSHLVASAKACDDLLAVAVPETAVKLRRLMNEAQMLQSHALSFFHLSSPDFLLGFDSDPAKRNILGVLEKHPTMARDGVRLRQIGQSIIELLGGKRVHPAWIVPGGVNEPLSADKRDKILSMIPEALTITQRALGWWKTAMNDFRAEIQSFANTPTLFLGLVDQQGWLEHYDGFFRVVDSRGDIVADRVPTTSYADIIGEAVEPWTYLKFPYYKPHGYPDGIYRVGPLARLNIIDRCGTRRADQEWAEFQEITRGAVLSSFYYHYARLIEALFAVETIENLCADPNILSKHVRAFANPNANEGIGVSEAPRGTLIHHYKIDDNGLITWANLIIATGHNNMAMNRGVLQVARHFIRGTKIEEGMLNRVEAVIRAFDPCLSCSTHAVGQMPMHVELVDPSGEVVRTLTRD